MPVTSEDFTTDADRWGYLAGARFVGPEEWHASLPSDIRHSLHLDTFADGLAAAADDEGRLMNFRPDRWYSGALSDVLRNDGDRKSWTLKYDRFAAMVVMDAKMNMLGRGLLATRGNGDSVDLRLALPAAEVEA